MWSTRIVSAKAADFSAVSSRCVPNGGKRDRSTARWRLMISASRMLCKLFGPLVRYRYYSSVRIGRPVVLPWFVSRRLSDARWWSFNHHILEEGEQIAFSSIKSDNLLKSVMTQEYSPESWAATPITLLATWSLINRLQPSCIVEFGSGTSTCIFAIY